MIHSKSDVSTLIIDRLGRMHISVNHEHDCWSIQTSNVRRWRFSDDNHEIQKISILWLDGVSVEFCQTCSYLKQGSEWKVSRCIDSRYFRPHRVDQEQIVKDEKWKVEERNGRQLGSIRSVLNTASKFYITYPEASDGTLPYIQLASDVSRNLYQYFAIDTKMVPHEEFNQVSHGNTIFINELPRSLPLTFPVSKDKEGGISLRLKHNLVRTYKQESGLGAIFLVPLADQALGLVILGADEEGLRRAMRLLPLRTGVGQPDFVISGRKSGWKGLAGVHALGFFDHDWQVTASSYVS